MYPCEELGNSTGKLRAQVRKPEGRGNLAGVSHIGTWRRWGASALRLWKAWPFLPASAVVSQQTCGYLVGGKNRKVWDVSGDVSLIHAAV